MKTGELKQLLRESGLRVTIQRVSVLRALTSAERPLSHADLVDILDGSGGDQATVYRCLVAFVEAGILLVASRANGIARYELKTTNESIHRHPHFVCEACGIVSCLPNVTVISPAEGPWAELVKNAEVQFMGDCGTCR